MDGPRALTWQAEDRARVRKKMALSLRRKPAKPNSREGWLAEAPGGRVPMVGPGAPEVLVTAPSQQYLDAAAAVMEGMVGCAVPHLTSIDGSS